MALAALRAALARLGLAGITPAAPPRPEHDWPTIPLIAGNWRTVSPDLGMTLMIRLCAQHPHVAKICASNDVIALRQRTLISIRDGILVEYLTRSHDDGSEAIGAFVYRPGLLDPLTGYSDALYGMAHEGALVLDTAEQALEYAQLFCGATNGDEGCFMPVRPDMALRATGTDPALAAQLARATTPPTAQRAALGWELDMGIAYGPMLFRSKFQLYLIGMVEMVDDQHVCGVVPEFAQRWDKWLRRSEPIPADAGGWPCTVCAEREDPEETSDGAIA